MTNEHNANKTMVRIQSGNFDSEGEMSHAGWDGALV
jgi:hypothetical protein